MKPPFNAVYSQQYLFQERLVAWPCLLGRDGRAAPSCGLSALCALSPQILQQGFNFHGAAKASPAPGYQLESGGGVQGAVGKDLWCLWQPAGDKGIDDVLLCTS